MKRAVLLALGLLALSACVDTGAVAKFARAAHASSGAFHGIVSGSAASCEHSVEFFDEIHRDRPGGDANKPDCAFYGRFEKPALSVNDAYFGYLSALGGLAGADPKKLTSDLAPVQTELTAADSHLSADDLARAGAASGLARLITEALINGWRQRRLRSIMEQADPAVQNVSQVLAVIAERYRLGLNAELRFGREYCTDQIARFGSREPLAAALFRRQCENDREAAAKKVAGVTAYRKAVETAAATHHMLATSKTKWDAAFLRSSLPELQQLADAADAAAQAF